MIKIELSFATYADAIRALEAVNALALVNPAPQRDTPSGTVRPKAGTPEEQVKAHAEAVKAEKPAPKAEPKAAVTETVTSTVTQEGPKVAAVEYKDVQAAVLALSQIDANEADEADRTGRVAVQAILKEMGLATFKGSPAEVWPTAVAKLKAKLAELQGA